MGGDRAGARVIGDPGSGRHPRAHPQPAPRAGARTLGDAGESRGSHGRRDRLQRAAEFDRARQEGRQVWGTRMVLYVLPREGSVRAGFVAGRRIGGAVVRNRARRQLREAWRALAPSASGGFDIVIAARPAIRGAKMRELIDDMDEALGRAGLIER